MFCPSCGHERTNRESKFCSGCGYLLTGTAELLETGGNVPNSEHSSSARTRGLKHGVFIILLGFLIVPLIVVFSIWTHVTPFFTIASAIGFTMGGLLRIAYALMFESTVTGMPTMEDSLASTLRSFRRQKEVTSLPEKSLPESSFEGVMPPRWMDTNELQPINLSESSTKPLGSGELRQ